VITRKIKALGHAPVILGLLLLWGGAGRAGVVDDPAGSCVQISVVSELPNYTTPWNTGQLVRHRGSGFVISNRWVVTCAHVVAAAKFITVRSEHGASEFGAKVAFLADDCDLALLRVADDRFFDGVGALPLGQEVRADCPAVVYGYPNDGNSLAELAGNVSKFEYQTYKYPGIYKHLTFQVDAPVTVGTSGGPVLQNGAVAGVAFETVNGPAGNVLGYAIPIGLLNRLVRDVQDGVYDGVADLGVTTVPMVNADLRQALLPEGRRNGVMVSAVYREGSADGALQVGDVIEAIDGRLLNNFGNLDGGGRPQDYHELLDEKQAGQTVAITGFRNRVPFARTIVLKAFPYRGRLFANPGADREYVCCSGMVFQPLSFDVYNTFFPLSLTARRFLDDYLHSGIYLNFPEPVVLTEVLPDSANGHETNFLYEVVRDVDGVPIARLADLNQALNSPSPLHVIRFCDDVRPLVVDAAQAGLINRRIRKAYGIDEDVHLGMRDR